MKIRPVGTKLFQADGETDILTWRSSNRCFSQLCENA